MENLVLSMFKTYDIRTKQENLDDCLKNRLYNALAVYYRDIVKAKSIVIGRDTRLYVPEIAQGLAQAMSQAGLEVYLNPLPISTCQFYFTCMQHRDSAGIMVTASHNPKEYVGMKLMAPQLQPIAFQYGPEGGIAKIKELYINNSQIGEDKHGKVTVINYLDRFISYSMKIAGVKDGDLAGLKIMLEFLNGSAGAELALAFQRAGADVDFRNIVPDGFFRMGDPNPIIESSIAPARVQMKEGNYDIGFCFDGDGDRMDIMAANGQQIVPGLNMAIICEKIKDIYKGTKNVVYADVKAIPTSLCEIAKKGLEVHIIRNGHSFIKGKLRDNCDNGYFAAEEESAHYYMNFPFDPDDLSQGYAAVESTLFFALLTARCYKENPKAYERAFEIQNSIYRFREWPLHCEAAPERMQSYMDEVEAKMASLGAVIIKDMDDGSDLDACLMRFNLPKRFDASSSLDGKTWVQVSQRISRSEDAMCRWEVVSNDPDECKKYNDIVRSITDKYVQAGWAKY